MYVNTKEMLMDAKKRHYSVIAADCWSLDCACALIDTAIECDAPLIVMLWDGAPSSIADPQTICEMVKMKAGKTRVPIAMHFDHGLSIDTIIRAIHAGFSSVMIDASKLPFDDNVSITKEVVRLAHACNITVEAELGHVGTDVGKVDEKEDHVDKNEVFKADPSVLTLPEEAAEFVEKTGVDSLAISIGTVHGLYKGTPHLDFQRLKNIESMVNVPLVLHGGSGTGIPLLKQAAELGICKLNIMTDLLIASKENVKPSDKFWEISIRSGIQKSLREYIYAISKPWNK